MKKVYYAHTKYIYGTPTERAELKHIRRRFPQLRIVNPARYEGDPEKLRDTMGFCLRLVERCDAVIFSRLRGRVTAGVGKEVNHALSLGKPVLELSNGRFKRRRTPVKYLSVRETLNLWSKSHSALS
jgi:hypothetical protein